MPLSGFHTAGSLINELNLVVVAWCAFALFCGGTIKGTLGIGTPLLTVPMMALVLPVQQAVAIMALPVVVANVWQVFQARHVGSTVSRFWPVFIALLVGTVVGASILSVIGPRELLFVVGVIVIAFTLLQCSDYKLVIPLALEKPTGVAFGMVGGVVGGVSSMFGPSLIIYLVSLRDLANNQFVGAIGFLYVSAVLPWAIALYALGILRGTTLLYSAAAIAPVVVGMLVGQLVRKRIADRHFRIFVLLILFASGATMLWRAWQLTP